LSFVWKCDTAPDSPPSLKIDLHLWTIPKFFQISGWGATTADKTVQPVHLQVASVTTINCTINDFITFNNDHICAGGSGIGICTNDVGGPMVLNSMLVGIPFFHDPRVCGGQGTPPIPVSNFF